MISRDGDDDDDDDDDDTPLFRKTKAEETKTKPVREKNKKTKTKRKKGSRHGSFVIRMSSCMFFSCFLFFGVVCSLVSHERNL